MSQTRQHSAIYRGWLRHRRTAPTRHAFRYEVAMFYIDLDELDALAALSRLFRVERTAPISFHRRDYLGSPEQPLASAVRDLVEKSTGVRPTGPIRLLTNPRYFGYAVNPVSFYYCFDEAGDTVETIVADIVNTPWKERHSYVLGAADEQGAGRTRHYRFSKEFHVSPFMAMQQDYDWRFTAPEEKLAVHMVSEQGGEAIFDATLCAERAPLDARSIRQTLLRYPLMTGKVVSAIYWNALKLKLKGTPFFDHPAYAEGRSPYSSRSARSERSP